VRAPGAAGRDGAAGALWDEAGAQAARLRAHGVRPGDRVLCALPAGPAFAALLVAALWEELTFAPVPDTADADRAADEVDARVVVAADGAARLRTAQGPPTPAARLLLQTSGTTGARRWVALSDANVCAVLDSHAPALALGGATVLSVLPWHHAFGLVIQLLPALAAGADVVRDPGGGRDVDALLRLAAEHPVTHLDAVPHTAGLLAARADGRALLARLRGGVVGGAPIDAALAAALAATRLRVGYGQTEASPGIALGAPGAWRAGTLGRPLGCRVRVDADGVLAFRGPNACLGLWEGGRLVALPPDRWARTATSRAPRPTARSRTRGARRRGSSSPTGAG
jgi:acyl-CoA synthetase (AMP-forming)/AMP-acid ligase II